MNEPNKASLLLCIAVALLGAAVGYFVGDDSSQRNKSQAEIKNLRSELERIEGSRLSALRPRLPSEHRTVTKDASDRPVAKIPQQDSTSDWKAVREELGRSNHIASLVTTIDDQYNQVLHELGLESTRAERLKSNVANLYRKAGVAGKSIGDLASARYEHDKELRSILGEEDYQRYRYYEESKPAIREYNQLMQFSLNEKQHALDPNYSEKIVRLIKDAGATTTETWHEPYDPIPRPMYGESLTNFIGQNLGQLQRATNILLSAMQQNDIPAEYSQVVIDYYARKIQEKSNEMGLASQTEADYLRAAEERMKRDRLETQRRAANKPIR